MHDITFALDLPLFRYGTEFALSCNWLEYAKRDAFYGQFWDPANAIGSEISGDLVLISSRDFDWPKLIASGEWIGKKTEEEIDLTRRDERRQYDTDGNGRRMRRH